MHKGWINPFVPISSLVPMEKNQITNRVKEILKYHPSTLYSAFLVTWKCVLSRSLSRKYSRSCLMLSIEHDSILDSAVIICWIEGSFIKWPPCILQNLYFKRHWWIEGSSRKGIRNYSSAANIDLWLKIKIIECVWAC